MSTLGALISAAAMRLRPISIGRSQLPAAALSEIQQELSAAARGVYLEYGAGGSTVTIAPYARRTVTVDSDRRYLTAVRRSLEPAEVGKVSFVHANIGLTGESGWPIFRTPRRGWARYADSPWELPVFQELPPDVVLVDGRFRIACVLVTVLQTLARGKPVIFVDDFGERPEYQPILDFVEVEQMLGRTLRCIPKSVIDPRRLRTTLEHYYLVPN